MRDPKECKCKCTDEQRPDDGRGNGRRRPRIKKEPRGVWLLIRYDLADTGVRPVPNDEVFWLSPDIWITGGDALGNAIAGKPTKVRARIWNLGNFPSTPTRVDFAFVDPSLGIPWNAPKLIGTAWTTVPALGTAVVECPQDWVPGPTGTTHACLLVTCSSYPLDPPTDPGNTRTDRHTGQRNVTIVQATAGDQVNLDFLVARTLKYRGAVKIGAMIALGNGDPNMTAFATRSLDRTLRTLTRAMPSQKSQLLARRSLVLHGLDHNAQYEVFEATKVHEMLQIKVDAERFEAQAFGLRGGQAPTELALLGGPLTIEPLSSRQAKFTLVVPAGDCPLIVHFYQFEDDIVTGGHTVIVHRGTKETRDPMNGSKSSLEQLVIEANPGARITQEIVTQLVSELPLTSPDQLRACCCKHGLKIGGVEVPVDQILSTLPAEVFPICDEEDLVMKVAASIRTGVEIMARTDQWPQDADQAKLASTLAREPRNRAEVAAGYFGGPSLFGCTRAIKAKGA